MNKVYSTAQVAMEAGVHKQTLLRWLYAREIPEPVNKLTMGKMESRIWTEEEMLAAKAYKEQNYRKRS